MFKEKIIIEMKEVFKEIPFGIEHTLKVLKNAEDIMKGENIGEEEKEFISIIAILHDIGAVEAQKKRNRPLYQTVSLPLTRTCKHF